MESNLGTIIVLNGTPRSGKSSIAQIIQAEFNGIWMNIGVDGYMNMMPERVRPGIGLRPGGESPSLEPTLVRMYVALYESIAAHSRAGLNVVVDVGHHDDYATPRGILPRCAEILEGLPAWFIGVRCPIEVVMKRRIATWGQSYEADGTIPAPFQRWQEAVHRPGIYDLEVDTSVYTPQECAQQIGDMLNDGHLPSAFVQLAALRQPPQN